MKPITIQLTADDYVSANKLHSRFGYLRIIVFVLILFIVITLWSSGWHAKDELALIVELASVLGVALLLGGIWLFAWFGLVRYVYMPWRVRRIFRQQKNLQRPFELSWDDENLFTTSANGNARIPWIEYLKWRENQRLFLLYRSDVLFQMFPKRAFIDSTQLDEFRRLASAKISPVQGRRRKVG